MTEQEKSKLNIIFVGHVDHGKSTLIGRILFDTNSLSEQKISEVKTICREQGRPFEFAFLMDHLEEERAQNITIDTAHIFFKTKKRGYVIIDAPGHKEFMKNMITGASQANAAILLVDVNEGVQEQTKRHAKFLSLLGLNQVIVVINKLDKIDYQEEKFKEVKNNLLEFLKKVKIIPSFIIPISARDGENIAKQSKKMLWYKDKTFLEALDTFQEQEDKIKKPLRFPVQDVYKFDVNRVIVGQIATGTINVGDPVIFLPIKKQSTVKSVEIFNQQTQKAQSGESIGITINDSLFVNRGDIITEPNSTSVPITNIKGTLFWMSAEPLKIYDSLTLQCATQETGITIRKISERIDSSTLQVIKDEAQELKETEVATVFLETDDPIITEDFNNIPELGRFTLARNGIVVAGGIITK